MPEPRALGGALDQAGDVGEHELAVLGVERAQHRLERRERIVGDLRRRPREPPQQRRLARVRLPDQARRRRAASGAARSSPPRPRCPSRRSAAPGGSSWRSACCRGRRARRARRPRAARARPGRSALRSRPSTWVPGGTEDHPVLARAPRAAACPAPWPPRPARKWRAPLKPGQVAPRRVADQHDVPPAPAVAAVGPAARHMRLAPKAHAAVAAAPALDVDLRLVVEHGTRLSGRGRGAVVDGPGASLGFDRSSGRIRPTRAGRAAAYSASATETTRPLRPVLNSTDAGAGGEDRVVAAEAGAVARAEAGAALADDDLAAADLLAGEDLHPEVFGFESRPLRLEPSPFLCAMI